MSDREVIIIGASGHGKVIVDIIHKLGNEVIGFLDDDPLKKEVHQIPVLGRVSDAPKYENKNFVIGIGDNQIRKKISEKYSLNYITVIHPSAVIGENVCIGRGTIVMANAVINADTSIGIHCIINTAAIIEHDCVMGDYVHVSPKACLCGNVQIGKYSHICAGATVINNKKIIDKVIIGAGSTVIKDIEYTGTYVGIPVSKVE